MYKLMIVDDEALIRRGIKSLADLSGLGISEVAEASNAEEALHLCASFEPNLILLDINMPKMDGLSFAKLVKERLKNVKICMITGYDYFEYAVQALRAGVDEYILKPVSRKDVDEVLRKMIQLLEHEAIEKEVALIDLKGPYGDDAGRLDDVNVLKLKGYVEKHVFDTGFSLSVLADRMGFSLTHLSGVFKAYFGMTFQDYVTKARIDKAKLLLLTTDMRNYEIAEAIGFEDVNYFVTRFKKVVGVTPKGYQNQVRGRDGN
jgi:two-component system response regulator YesN